MQDKHSMQIAFEHIALQNRGEHGMLCDFRKDLSGNYMSACERAAFWAWSKVEHLYSFEGSRDECIGSVVRSFDATKKHDDFAGDTITSFDLAKGKDSTVATKVLKLGDAVRVIDFDLDIPSVRDDLEERTRMFDRLPNRNGMVYSRGESPNLHFSDLPAETQDKFRQAVDRLEKNAHRPSISVNPLTPSDKLTEIIKEADALGLNVKLDYSGETDKNNPSSMSFSVTTMNDIPKQGEKQMVYNIDQLAFLPELNDIPFCEENSKRLDEAFNKLKGKLADSVQKDYKISLTSPYSTPLYKTIPEDQFKIDKLDD